MDGNIKLDSSAFDTFISKEDSIKNRYEEINKKFSEIVKGLDDNWRGKGATAFQVDADIVKNNINNIQDVLETMCMTLNDCREIFLECDSAIAAVNDDH